MARYQTSLTRTLSTSQTLGTLYTPASAMRRIKVFRVEASSLTTPSDSIIQWQAQRFTGSNGTATAVTPTPMDQADAACVALSSQAHSAEPSGPGYTSGAVLDDFDLYQKSTYLWETADKDSMLVIPASATNGIGWKTPTINPSSTPSVKVNLRFEE